MPQPQLFSTEAQGDTLVVVALENIGSLASMNVRAEADALLEQFRGQGLKHVVIDLEKAEYFGTYMLELMNALWRHIRHGGGKLALYHVSEIGREVLHIARLDRLWPICNTMDEALNTVAE